MNLTTPHTRRHQVFEIVCWREHRIKELETHKTGEFLYDYGRQTERIHSTLFKTKVKPKQIFVSYVPITVPIIEPIKFVQQTEPYPESHAKVGMVLIWVRLFHS